MSNAGECVARSPSRSRDTSCGEPVLSKSFIAFSANLFQQSRTRLAVAAATGSTSRRRKYPHAHGRSERSGELRLAYENYGRALHIIDQCLDDEVLPWRNSLDAREGILGLRMRVVGLGKMLDEVP